MDNEKIMKCPHCKMEIESFNVVERDVIRYFKVWRGYKSEYLDWEEEESQGIGNYEFNCPDCSETITTYEEEARDFLVKGKEIKE